MIDHVTLRVSEIDESRRFYEAALAPLGLGPATVGDHFFEWEDLSISAARNDRPLTRRAHVALAARSPDDVDAFWRAATDAGFRDNGAPGLRPGYHDRYYAAYLLDPDGTNVEAVHHGRPPLEGEMFDHITLRVRDPEASRRFYESIASVCGFELVNAEEGLVRFRGHGEGPWLYLRAGDPSENVHLAFRASDRATVDEFHRRALAVGYRDNGAPGERARYHPGYYGAYVLDPDGNNVESVFHDR